MKTQRFIAILCLAAAASVSIGAQVAEMYRNPLTGQIQFYDWSNPVNGLQCRLGVRKTTFALGGETPVVMLQVHNVTSQPIAINDLLNPTMLLLIKPSKETYYGDNFQWVFDENRKTLPAGEGIEAVCRIPAKLMPTSAEYEISVSLSAGVYPPNTHGTPGRWPNWWTGSIQTPPLKVKMQ